MRGCWRGISASTSPAIRRVIVQNQPGAGSLTMTNQMYAAGPFDGTVIGASFNGLPTTPLLQPERRALRRDQDELGRQHQSRDAGHVCLAHRAGPNARRSQAKEMIVGAQAPGSTQYDYPMLGRTLFG